MNLMSKLFGVKKAFRHYWEFFDGEKNFGEMGPAKRYTPDTDTLRTRAWQMYLENDLSQLVINKFTLWVVGSGLKLQAEPAIEVLKDYGLNIDRTKFAEEIEAKYRLFKASKRGDYCGNHTVNQLSNIAFKNKITGGDILIVLRYIKGEVKVQLIDGEHVNYPYISYGDNCVKEGIEIDSRGQIVAFHIQKKDYTYERIEAVSRSTGLTVAYLVKGLRYRIENYRGMPLLTAVMETAKKIERYKEATLGSAEERAKLPFTVEHQIGGSGENPIKSALKAFNTEATDPLGIDMDKLSQNIAISTNKRVYNLPQGASLRTIDSKQELYFEGFTDTNIGILSATIGIPKDIAMSIYNSNFSASRAAIKDWEHKLDFERDEHGEDFEKPIFVFWLYCELLNNRIKNAPGLLTAFRENNYSIIDAFTQSRYIGANVPHIDPVKEATAERIKLGKSADHLPLTTIEDSVLRLNSGDSWNVMQRFRQELEDGKGIGEAPE